MGILGWGPCSGCDKEYFLDGIQLGKGMIILHESLHFAVAKGRYIDRELAWAGYRYQIKK